MSAPGETARIAVRIRAADGTVRDDGWVRTVERPVAARIGEGALIALGGTAVGVLLLPIPLIHLFGVIFAVSMWGLGLHRARTRTVVVEAGGTCPRCEQAGTYYAGFGRKRFRLPISTSCPHCASSLSLEPLPSGPPSRA
jgi:hypothetical protein